MMRPLLRLARLGGPDGKHLLLAVLAGVAALGSGVGLFAVSGYLIARAAEHPEITELTLAIVAVRAFAIGRAVFRYLERLASHDVALRVLGEVRVWLYDRLQHRTGGPLSRERSGDLVVRLVSDVDGVQDLFVRGLIPIVTGAVVAFCVVGGVVVVSVPAAVVLAIGLAAAGALLPWIVQRVTDKASGQVAGARGRLAAETADTFAGAADLTAFGGGRRALRRVNDINAEMTGLARRQATALGLGTGLSALIFGLTVWFVLMAGVSSVRAGELSPVAFAVLALIAMAAFEVTQPLPAAAAALTTARAGAGRIFAVADTQVTVAEPQKPQTVPAGPAAIQLRGVRARYDDNGPWALDGVDLDLVPGHRLALVGANGAGKSTVLAVLLRFLDLSEGSALLDGVPLATYCSVDLHRVISGVTQDPHIFATTLRDNLRIGRPGATDEELAEVASRARLVEWVETLPSGWDTHLGTAGGRVSGGERQRIALARALLADPQVLLLDEPTAHLDEDTAAALTADLLDATLGRTTLLVTHHPAGLDAVDEVVRLDAGRVVDRWTN